MFWIVILLWVVLIAGFAPDARSPTSFSEMPGTHDRNHRRSPHPAPASPPAKQRRVNWEKWGWIYMRVRGVLLRRPDLRPPVRQPGRRQRRRAIDFAFVAGKWANPFWLVWDTLLLWLALIHGANGMRTIINDYARNRTCAASCCSAILAAAVVLSSRGPS